MITSREIACLACLSHATVSWVLQRSSLVWSTTGDRVTAVVDETGYQANRAARELRTHRTGAIGIVLADLTNAFISSCCGRLVRHWPSAGCT